MDKPLRMLFAASSHEDLLDIVRSVRRRWRLGMLLRGLSIVASVGLAAFLLSAYGMDQFRFNPTAVLAFRVVVYGTLLGLIVVFVVLPLRKRVSDEQVALYLEEHEPSLTGHVVSGVQFGAEANGGGSLETSPALIKKLVRRAIERCVSVEEGRRVDRVRIARSSGLLASASMAGMVLFLLSPGFVRYSLPYLVTPWRGSEATSPYSIVVEPGDVALARGADLRITAMLQNFDSDGVDVAVKRGDAGEWERWPMTVDEETGQYVILVFDIAEQTDYFVEASGVRSPLFRIDVSDLPYVDRIDLEYHFPSYTGLSPTRQENGGDIAAVAGTRVQVEVTPTIEVPAGAILLNDRDTLVLEAGGQGIMTGTVLVDREGLYRILLESHGGSFVTASPDYLIDVLEDQPPSISFTKPGRDINVSSIEEVFTEVRAEDDFGVAGVELVYAVNGGPERVVDLYAGGVRQEVSASHTFFLEEERLEPGDFVSYFARTTESPRKAAPQTAATDIYFMEVRPFNREYRQAEQQGGQQGMQGGQGPGAAELSSRQRDIIAGTFRMVRDRERYTDEEYRENLATLALAQGKLREEVEILVQRMASRGIVQLDSVYQTIATELPQAVEQMALAERLLGERNADSALSPEQKALGHLQRAEAAYREVQVSRGSNQRGGGQGGEASDPEDLADLFELELDRMRNQYEQVQRGRRQEGDQELDEIQEKLKELAQRQQQENERLRARQQSQAEQGVGSGGEAQRRLADEAEELARRLERLAREDSRPELERTIRNLREAAEDMRRAAANARNSGVAQGVAALDQLREARRRLDQDRGARLGRDAEDALRRVRRLAEEERQVMSEVQRIAEDPSQLDRLSRVRERKESMAAEVADIEAQLERLSRESQRDQREAARKLSEAAKSIRDNKLREKILYSRGVIATGSREYIRNFEEQIQSDIDRLEQLVGEGADAVGESREQRLARSLDQASDAVKALESLNERMRDQLERQQEPREQSETEQQEGQQGQRAQQGRQGEQGQQSQQQGGAGQPRGGDQPPAMGGPGGPARLNPDAARQFGRELAERESELTQLRQQLEREGIDVGDLDNVIGQLRGFSRRREFGDPLGLDRLELQIIQGLKDFEYALRRQFIANDDDRPLLAGSDEVPSGYRELVEQYYRELSRRGAGSRP